MLRFFALSSLVYVLANSFGVHAQGLDLLDPERYASIPLAPRLSSGPIPVRVDLSKDFPNPGNQGDQSSCVGWALGYGLKSYQENIEFRSQGHRVSFQFSPSFVYNQLRSNPSCKGGINIVDALGILETQGILPVDKFPYSENECSSKPSPVQIQNANEWGIARWFRVNVQSEADVKSNLAGGFPVVIAMAVDDAFQQLKDDTYLGQGGQSQGFHAMVVVGYDDNRQAFRVFNSWGTKWADHGLAWIPYALFKKVVREGYAVFDIVRDRRATDPQPSPRPNPDPTPKPRPRPNACEPPADASYRVTAVESWDVLNLREDRNRTARIVTKIPFDAAGISVRRCEAGWCEIQHACSTGWVNAKFLTSAPVTAGLHQVVNVAMNDVLYMRPAPKKLSEFTGTIPWNAADVRLTECLPDSSWCKVSYGNKSGWVNSKYLSARK